jgi:tetratricopeptide (TPR) repeat protein
MDTLRKKGDSAGLNRTRNAYLKFLTALVESKAGQTYESLKWAGDNMLTLNHPKEAEDVFHRVLKLLENDPKAKSAPGAADRVLHTRLKLAASLRGQGRFGEAESMIAQLLQENPRVIEPMMERGYLLEDIAAAGKGSWAAAFAEWQKLAQRLGAARTKPTEYYEAWYHAALALSKENKRKEAKQTLASVIRLSARSIGPEMKQKYQTLLDQMK